MIFFLVGAGRKEVFRILFRFAREEELNILWLGSRRGEEIYKNLHFRYERYFSLLKANRKTLRDLILEGRLREYEFSRVVSRDLFVPKKRGDLLYWAYLSEQMGEKVELEGYQEFKAKVLELKRKEGFIDWVDVEEVELQERVVVFQDLDEYSVKVLRALWRHAERFRKKVFIFLMKTERPELIKYFSYAQRNVEIISHHSLQSIVDFPLSLMTRKDLMERVLNSQERWTIYEWDRRRLFEWVKELAGRGMLVGVPGDYEGERIFLSLPTKPVRTQRAFFGACAFPSAQTYYIRAMAKAQEIFLAEEDLPYWGLLAISPRRNLSGS